MIFHPPIRDQFENLNQGSIFPSDQIRHKELLTSLIAQPPTPTIGLAALMACAELEIIVEIPTLRQGALKCLADLTVIIHRPPAGILDGVVKMIHQTVRTCPLSHIISIGIFFLIKSST